MAGFEEVTNDNEGNLFTARSFLEQLRRSNPAWWDGDEEGQTCRWFFRGHKDARWELIPSAFRNLEFNELKPLIETIKKHPTYKSEYFQGRSDGFKSAAYRYAAFYVALKSFYDLALELGLTDEMITLDDPHSMAGSKIKPDGMQNYFDACSHQIVSLAQHHGIPTPFLDWTRKPEVAVHFASAISPKEEVKDISVYALKIDRLSDPGPRGPRNTCEVFLAPNKIEPREGVTSPFHVVLDAPMKNSYLAAQQGIFTMSNDLREFFETGVFPALETEISKLYNQGTIVLKKFVLPKEEVSALRQLLDREGLSEAHLMPTLDKVGQTVKSRWSMN